MQPHVSPLFRIRAPSRSLPFSYSQMQIVVILKSNHTAQGGKEVTAPYSNFLDAVSFMTLDAIEFVPFSCMYTNSEF